MKLIKRASLVIILALLVLCISSDSSAFFEDGNNLVRRLREFEKARAGDPNANYDDATYYMGFVIGVHDATAYNYNTPSQITVGQIWAVVAKYLKDNPEKWSQPASLLVMEALRKAFPKR